MASSAPSAALTQESLVTIKVNLDRTSHKFKLPLRFLGARCLEEKLRSQLSIPSDANIRVERFSDSAAAYITLDPTNAAVFKQLQRAAKAKQKLKLRITTDKPSNTSADIAVEPPVGPAAEKAGPRPASVEDELEAEVEPEAPAAPLVDVSTPVTTSQQANQPHMFDPMQSAPQLAAVESLAQEKMDFSKTLLENLKQINGRLNDRSGECDIHRHSPVPAAKLSLPYRPSYAVRCNNCNGKISEFHYHCSSCDGGDFDLCMECVGAGETCSGTSHWMIKRVVKNGVIINSTTERLAPKPKAKPEEPKLGPKPGPEPEPLVVQKSSVASAEAINNLLFKNNIRTCNSCVQDMTDEEFLHCETCEDFDLCKACFAKNQHGHHPKHAFAMAVPGTRLTPQVTRLLGAGRGQVHHAICDGCDKNITGIRHKCMDCPDWDYCANCVVNAAFVHAGHRFVPIYEPIEFRARSIGQPVHHGICCDGPLCGRNGLVEYIVGDRYKCAVCNDTDFCAKCEANPANEHNRTHPLIKFKTPVRHVSVTTTGAHGDGQQMPTMGDLTNCPAMRSSRYSPPRHSMTASQNNTISDTQLAVQKLLESGQHLPRHLIASYINERLDAAEQRAKKKEQGVQQEIKQEVKEEIKGDKEVKEVKEEPAPKPLKADDLVAVYKSDTIADGTEFGPNQLFEQTWILRNEGQIPWPAGCSVKFVGGDYMGHVDSNHPAATSDIVSASESTVAHMPLFPGQEAQFSVLLRTPNRSGRAVSNWRLTTKDGLRFGHRLWCDVVVKKTTVQEIQEEAREAQETKEAEPVKEAEGAKNSQEVAQTKLVEAVEEKTDATASPAESKSEMAESQMIFPKLEKESPVASVHGLGSPTTSNASKKTEQEDEFEDCAEDDEWMGSDEGFVTDEEYDILDASDEEVLEGKRNSAVKK